MRVRIHVRRRSMAIGHVERDDVFDDHQYTCGDRVRVAIVLWCWFVCLVLCLGVFGCVLVLVVWEPKLLFALWFVWCAWRGARTTGELAHMVERSLCKREAGGSIPPFSTFHRFHHSPFTTWSTPQNFVNNQAPGTRQTGARRSEATEGGATRNQEPVNRSRSGDLED